MYLNLFKMSLYLHVAVVLVVEADEKQQLTSSLKMLALCSDSVDTLLQRMGGLDLATTLEEMDTAAFQGELAAENFV